MHPVSSGCIFFAQKTGLNQLTKRAPTEKGGKGGREAADSEQRRPEGADRRSARGGVVQVRQLAKKFLKCILLVQGAFFFVFVIY